MQTDADQQAEQAVVSEHSRENRMKSGQLRLAWTGVDWTAVPYTD